MRNDAVATMSTAKPPTSVVLRVHLAASPRKTAILLILVVVMVVVYARWYFKSRVTSEASASVSVAQAPAGQQNVSPGHPAASPKLTAVPARITLSAPLPEELARNPFEVDLAKFPPADEVQERGTTSSAPAEALRGDPDEEMRKLASGLVLQSTLCGAWPVACISGQVVWPGQEIGGFMVMSVRPTQVVLRRDQVEVALTLKK